MSVVDKREFDTWRENALWAITTDDVDALCEDLPVTPEERERIYHRVSGMDASYMMECVLELIHYEIGE